MNSKNKKIKEPGADQKIFSMVRDYCKAPWVSTNKELPESGKLILLAYYSGIEVGYRMAVGWLVKHPLQKKKVKAEDKWIISYFGKLIDVSEITREKFCSSDYENEDNLSKNYEIIEEDGIKKALVWFIYVPGGSIGIFKNSTSANSTFFPDLNELMYPSYPSKEYSKPDFWMYIPEIK